MTRLHFSMNSEGVKPVANVGPYSGGGVSDHRHSASYSPPGDSLKSSNAVKVSRLHVDIQSSTEFSAPESESHHPADQAIDPCRSSAWKDRAPYDRPGPPFRQSRCGVEFRCRATIRHLKKQSFRSTDALLSRCSPTLDSSGTGVHGPRSHGSDTSSFKKLELTPVGD